ncbi:MAG: restriction endonuclease subunit S [Nanoarchaeota archaeon]|nr:restriction endonuclease subunit S [Nanoarchaeota archaeon]
MELYELPKGWVWTRLVDACQYLPTGVEKFDEDIEYYSTGSIHGTSYVPEGIYSFSERPSRANRMGHKRDVLQARMAGTNKALLIGENLDNKLFSTGFIQLRAFNCCVGMSSYIHYYVQSRKFLAQRDALATGSTQVALTDSRAEQITFPLSPLPEQHRIVSKIEEQFTKLDAGVEALKKVKTQLKRYRQSVLKSTMEGKLTEKWREEHKHKFEPASALLEKIKEERKKNTKEKYKELPPVDTENLPELPKGWCWVRVGEISEMIQYGTSEKAGNDSSGIPVLRMGNIQDGKLLFEDLKYFPRDWLRLDDFILHDGDVLFNRTNSAELVGKTAVYKSHYPTALFASYLIRVNVNRNAYIPDVLSFFINSFYGRKYIASVVSQQVGQANVNGTKLSLMPIPFSPLPEQHKIVEEIEKRFTVADEGEKAVEKSLKQAERLRQSILKKAFEGKLVPQDPTDEPASVLLERIKKEKEKLDADRKVKRKGRRVKKKKFLKQRS